MTTDTRTIKVSTNNYHAICEFAGELQKARGQPVSVDRAISELLNKRPICDLAGSWKMNDDEAKTMLQSLKKGWSSWKTKSA